MANPITAYIGLGGNIGDVLGNMHAALKTLNMHKHISVKAISNIYKTPPWGIKEQDWFLNACASVETTLSAQELLRECLDAEKALKRVRDIRWGPRTIDLDVLFFCNQQINEDNLQVPHPRIHERAFVLMPMADLAPELALEGKTIAEWLEVSSSEQIEKTDYSLSSLSQ